MTRPRQSIRHLPLAELCAHPGNVRTGLGDLSELAASIREHGILQPLTATERTLGGTEGGEYVLLAGHRRLAAARLAGLRAVPVVIRHDLDDRAEQIVVMLVENVQRRDLSPIEKAEAFGSLRRQGLNLAEISRRTGVQQSTVSTLLALLELDDASREELRAGNVRAGDAISAVRRVRQEKRKATGTPARGRPVVVEPHYFGPDHPLCTAVFAQCDHTTRPKVGRSGACGQCWEAAIRADALKETPAP